MARSDLLLTLVRTGAKGDELAFRRAVEALIAEESNKKHEILATQLGEALNWKPRLEHSSVRKTERFQASTVFTYEKVPERRLADLVLTDATRQAIDDLIEEHHRRDLLRSYGVEPRHRVMLVGPPGGGKTSLAEAIATELALPLLTVRYEGIIGSFLGETADRLESLFQQIRSKACVFFFDEFDVVAKERGDVHESGEIKRVVSSLLLQVDGLPSHVIVVAATNHPELLDRAVWRRMQIRVNLPKPSRKGRIEWLNTWSNKSKISFGLSVETIVDRLNATSYSDLENFAFDVQRRLILDGPDSNARSITQRVLRQWNSRLGEEIP